MHTYRKSEENLWTVGYYLLDEGTSCWQPAKDFSNEIDAARWVSFLNGGDGQWRGGQ